MFFVVSLSLVPSYLLRKKQRKNTRRRKGRRKRKKKKKKKKKKERERAHLSIFRSCECWRTIWKAESGLGGGALAKGGGFAASERAGGNEAKSERAARR